MPGYSGTQKSCLSAILRNPETIDFLNRFVFAPAKIFLLPTPHWLGVGIDESNVIIRQISDCSADRLFDLLSFFRSDILFEFLSLCANICVRGKKTVLHTGNAFGVSSPL